MKQNKELEEFYQEVHSKGEKKHYTFFVTKGTPSSDTKEILKEVNWKSKKVLDVGCGTGYFAYIAAQKGANVLGIDFTDKAIEIAQRTYNHSRLHFKKLDATKISDKYDVIVSIGVLEHMDSPYNMLKLFKSHLKPNGKIIISTPNWTNPRGYILMTLWFLFNAPVTLADLHYFTPVDHIRWSKKLGMGLRWRTYERSWAHGDMLIADLERRIPRVLKDAKLPINKKRINLFLKWIRENVNALDNSLPQSGATGLYVYTKKE